MGRANIVFPYPDDNFLDPELPNGVMSPSGFNTYRRCPRQYWYAYVEKLKNPPGIAQVKGTAIHKGAEVVHKNTIENGDLLSLVAVQQSVSDEFDKEKEAMEDADASYGRIKDSAIDSITVYYNTAVPLINPVAVEKPFAVRIGTVPFRGIIDLVDSTLDDFALVEDPSEIPKVEVVADLKTTGKMWTEQKLKEEPQLTFYAMAENTDKVRIDFLLDQKAGVKYVPMRTLRSNLDKCLLVEDVEDVAKGIKQGFFPRCDPTSWGCNSTWCGYYHKCRGPK